MFILPCTRNDDQSSISSTRARTTRRGQRARALLVAGALTLAGMLGPAVNLGAQTISHAAENHATSAPRMACAAADIGCVPIRRA